MPAHVFALYLETGQWPPDGRYVCHTCDNPPCVYHGHLYDGTAVDNARDREERQRGNHPRGDARPNAKLTADDVMAMRALRAAGWTCPRLARLFGVAEPTALRIVRRQKWGHIP